MPEPLTFAVRIVAASAAAGDFAFLEAAACPAFWSTLLPV
jgi:hypothetical protein